MERWSDTELRATVNAYLDMIHAESSDQEYSKAAMRRALRAGPLANRTDQSIEYRMRNISAVFAKHDRPTVRGYLSAPNVGNAVAVRLWAMITAIEATRTASLPATHGQQQRRQLSAKRPPIVYFNVGWMKRYAGPATDDPTLGAHGYLLEHSHGAECFNFARTTKGVVCGYRPPGDRERTNITRMGASRSDTQIEGALVVWLAKEPLTKRTMVVGWYVDATVFREARASTLELNGEHVSYSATTSFENATLLPEVARTFEVRSSRLKPGAGFGQKPTWYGSEDVDERVWSYVRSKSLHRKVAAAGAAKKPPKSLDPELRRKVEKAAVQHAIDYYRTEYGADCMINSVETGAKGWDLEVFGEPDPLLVEVKGLLNSDLVCELTPNEYEKMMQDANRSRYIVYVVNNALAESPAVPIASIFEHVGETSWATADGRTLVIREKIGAVLTCI